MVLTVINGGLDEDPLFIPVAVMMIVGYTVTGAAYGPHSRATGVELITAPHDRNSSSTVACSSASACFTATWVSASCPMNK